jgi:hypothetical protein
MPSNNYIYKMSNAGGMSTVTRYTDMLAGNAVFQPSSYESISTVALTSTASTITFSSIPSTYQHLQIRFFGISAATYTDIHFNSDFAANYSFHQLTGDGSSATAGGGGSQSQIYGLQLGGSTSFASVGVIDILDYANTNKNTTVRLLSGVDSNGGGFIYYRSGAWFNTAAVNTIRFTAQGGTGTFAANTNVALYGIKG